MFCRHFAIAYDRCSVSDETVRDDSEGGSSPYHSCAVERNGSRTVLEVDELPKREKDRLALFEAEEAKEANSFHRIQRRSWIIHIGCTC